MTEEFVGSPRHTLGVEWEVAFVDRDTRELVPCAAEALDIIARDHPGHRIQREFLANTVELVTGVCDTVPDAMEDLGEQLGMVRDAARELGVDVWSSGSHPFSRGTGQRVSEKTSYSEIINRTQWWGRQMIIWGIHVHVGVRSAERVWPIINALLVNLPHMLALSASSPAWNGEDTGYASNRTLLYRQLPTAGLPPDIRDWESWQSYMADQWKSGVINHTGSMHFDIRPASKWGTVEVRISDAASNLRELSAIVALTHCLVVHYDRLWEAGEPLPTLQPWHVAENKWRGARYGMDALVITSRETDERWVKDELADLVEELTPLARELGCAAELARVLEISEHGAGYERQRRLFEETHSWNPAVDLACDELAAGHPLV